MGADWYYSMCVFGTCITVPEDKNFASYFHYLDKLFKESNFKLVSMLPSVHSRLEGQDSSEMYDYCDIILGIRVDKISLETLVIESEKLKKYMEESTSEVKFGPVKFYSGVEWCPDKDE
jgi:hypothetical protein